MKKLTFIFIVVLSVFALSACEEQVVEEADVPEEIIGTEDAVTIEDDLTIIMETILLDTSAPESEIVEIPANAYEYYFGIDSIEGAEAIASEAIGGTAPHSVCLMRVPEETDVSSVVASIQVNADPNKWMYEEAETVLVDSNGNLILLVMSTPEIAYDIVAKFEEIPPGDL